MLVSANTIVRGARPIGSCAARGGIQGVAVWVDDFDSTHRAPRGAGRADACRRLHFAFSVAAGRLTASIFVRMVRTYRARRLRVAGAPVPPFVVTPLLRREPSTVSSARSRHPVAAAPRRMKHVRDRRARSGVPTPPPPRERGCVPRRCTLSLLRSSRPTRDCGGRRDPPRVRARPPRRGSRRSACAFPARRVFRHPARRAPRIVLASGDDRDLESPLLPTCLPGDPRGCRLSRAAAPFSASRRTTGCEKAIEKQS